MSLYVGLLGFVLLILYAIIVVFSTRIFWNLDLGREWLLYSEKCKTNLHSQQPEINHTMIGIKKKEE